MLVPREHGAYGQLLFPALSALLIGAPAAAAWLLAVAGTAAFLAHEPALVLLGQRGSRAARDQRVEAWRSLAVFGGLALAAGAAALFLLPPSLFGTLAWPVSLAVVVAGFVASHRERTTAGELAVSTALASLSLPVARAGGVVPADAWTVFVVFASVFGTATVAVRALIGRTARGGGPSPALAGLLAIAAPAALAWAATAGHLASAAPWAGAPVFLVVLGLTVWPPHVRHLRTVGWTLVAATAATLVVLVAALY